MKKSLVSWLVLTVAAAGLLQGQIPPDYRTQILLYRDTPRGQVLDILLSGDKRTPLAERDDLITPFQMKSFRNGQANDVQLIARAPECHVDSTSGRGRAWDGGPMVLFTPTSNVWVQGEGFLFLQTNHLLYVSNNVETRVLRALLKTSVLSGARTNEPGAPGQILKVFAEGPALFDYQSNFVQYFKHVHVIDPQLDMTSERLSVQLTTNSAIQTLLAEDSVVMTTTNKGWATGARAFYYLTNGSEMTELTGGAVWHNGDEKARAEKFYYDGTRHLLTAMGNVRVWWPNAPQRAGNAPKADASGFRELWADFATLQMPPTNGPVEAMHATGNVLIVNQADHSSATSEEADYVRTNDLFELRGSPVWWNEQIEIKGRTLTAEATSRIYRARGGSDVKLKVTGSARTNQWLYISSEEVEYHTNLAVFHRDVKARLLEGDALRDTLTSDQLDVELFGNEVKTAVARGHVRGETAPDKLGRIKTIACDKMTAHRSPATKLMKDILAESYVVLRQFGTNAAEARDQLTAATVTAYFSAVTNQMERAVAERNVVIDHVKTNQTIHATGERAVYTVAADEVKLTGTPAARTDRYVIADSDFMIWQPKANRFQAFGPYTIVPIKATVGKSNAPVGGGRDAAMPATASATAGLRRPLGAARRAYLSSPRKSEPFPANPHPEP